MPLFFADLVREFSYGIGAGPLPLAGALPGHRPFADTVPAGARFHYCIAGVTRAEQWETGKGELQEGMLVREPAASSAGGAAVDFAPGLKTVALTVAAEWFAAQEAGGSDGPAAIEDIEGLAAALAAKAAAGHDHDGRYQPLDAELSAIAALAGAADKLPYFTGAGSAALADFGAAGRALAGAADAAAQRSALGLGSAATKETGTSGAAVPLLAGNNVHAGHNLFAAGLRQAGGQSARFEQILSAAPSGAAGLGIEIAGSNAGQSQIVSYNRTALAYGVLNIYGAVINFRPDEVQVASISTGGVSIVGQADVSGHYRVGGTKVVGGRATGWGTPSGTAARGGFDTASVTTAQLAERVKALIDDLAAHGLIGS
jgi:hypothetical protein